MENFKEVIRTFSPSWFAMVMGTGVFTSSMFLMGMKYHLEYLIRISHVFAFINFIIFSTVLIPFILKIVVFPEEVKKDVENPIKANFYLTFGVSMLTLASNFSVVKQVQPFYITFWFIGTFTVITIEFILMFVAFMGSHVKLHHINPSWFLGTTGLLLVPGVGSELINIPGIHDFVRLLFDFSFGSGFFLYLSLFAIWVYRFILHEPMKSEHIPIFWINMGPVGGAIYSLMSYYYQLPKLDGVATFFSMLFFGIGAWWLFMAISVTAHYAYKSKITYKTAWWSFTFPLGQFLVSSLLFNRVSDDKSISFFICFMFILLIVIWCINIAMTARALVKGEIVLAQNLE